MIGIQHEQDEHREQQQAQECLGGFETVDPQFGALLVAEGVSQHLVNQPLAYIE